MSLFWRPIPVEGRLILVRDILEGVKVAPPPGSARLQIFPLAISSDPKADHVLLDDLIEQQLFEIKEIGTGGRVPEVVVVNTADSDALILDGTELHGARKDRMVNITVIIAKHSHGTIPVSRVAAGRCGPQGPVSSRRRGARWPPG